MLYLDEVMLNGFKEHLKSDYNLHSEEHPSKFYKLLSSHSYIPIILPSPHFVEQTPFNKYF